MITQTGTIRVPKKAPFLSWYGGSFAFRRYFQFLGGIFVAVLLPAFVRWPIGDVWLSSSTLQNTVVGTGVAFVTATYFCRRLTSFPGVKASSYFLPTTAAAYAAMMLLFFLFRFEYARFQAVASFGLALGWFYGQNALARRIRPQKLAVVPCGDVDKIAETGTVNLHWLDQPQEADSDWSAVVVDLHADLSDAWEKFIADCALNGIPVFHVKQVRESLTGRVAIEHISENTLGSLDPNQAYLVIKQAIDWIMALSVLVFFAPFFAMLAILIRLDSPGSAIFRQERMGYRGKPFTVYKFRTMMQSNQQLDATSARDTAITKDGDQRVTKLGRVLRQTRLDEFPQILNILKGEMSWIGPRPEALTLSEWYGKELPFYPYRHIVRPGITGWAQVNQGHVADVDQVMVKLHYDFYYIKNFSLWLDVLIVLKTIRTMLTGFGAR